MRKKITLYLVGVLVMLLALVLAVNVFDLGKPVTFDVGAVAPEVLALEEVSQATTLLTLSAVPDAHLESATATATSNSSISQMDLQATYSRWLLLSIFTVTAALVVINRTELG